jgi:DNA-binding NarL/FixJ family response regulator
MPKAPSLKRGMMSRKFRPRMRSVLSDGTFDCGSHPDLGLFKNGLCVPSIVLRQRREGIRVNPHGETPTDDELKVLLGASGATLAGLRLALEADGIDVCGEATSVRDLITAVDQCRPDVCLVDVALEGDGLRAAVEICGRSPSTPVVLLAAEASEEQFLDAMRAGAVGYVPHSIAPSCLPNLVRAVLRGEAAVPRSFVMPLIDEYRQRPARRHLPTPNGSGADLTSREWQVLDFVQAGLSTREIAARLLISEVTVRRHISSVLKKLNVESRAAAMKLLQSA